MVCHDDRRAGKRFRELLNEPGLVPYVETNGVLGRETLFAIANGCEIVNRAARKLHGRVSRVVAVEPEIRPERRAEESHPVNLTAGPVQHAYVGRRGGLEPFRDANVVVIVLMVAGHVDDGHVAKLLRRPFDTAGPNADIAGEYDDVSIGPRRFEIAELGMQVAPEYAVSSWLCRDGRGAIYHRVYVGIQARSDPPGDTQRVVQCYRGHLREKVVIHSPSGAESYPSQPCRTAYRVARAACLVCWLALPLSAAAFDVSLTKTEYLPGEPLQIECRWPQEPPERAGLVTVAPFAAGAAGSGEDERVVPGTYFEYSRQFSQSNCIDLRAPWRPGNFRLEVRADTTPPTPVRNIAITVLELPQDKLLNFVDVEYRDPLGAGNDGDYIVYDLTFGEDRCYPSHLWWGEGKQDVAVFLVGTQHRRGLPRTSTGTC